MFTGKPSIRNIFNASLIDFCPANRYPYGQRSGFVEVFEQGRGKHARITVDK
jgi:hypothetical protein